MPPPNEPYEPRPLWGEADERPRREMDGWRQHPVPDPPALTPHGAQPQIPQPQIPQLQAPQTQSPRPEASWRELTPHPLPGSGVAPRHPVRNGVAVAAAVVGVLALAAGTVGVRALGGGGPQPESVLPADTLGFVRIDLDPSASQKVAMLRFARNLPEGTDVPDDEGDVRRSFFDGVKDLAGLGAADYAQDIEPWLGTRFAVALAPGAKGAEPVPLVVLGVTDADQAATGIALSTSKGGGCEVGTDFAVCSSDARVARRMATRAAQAPLAEAATYVGDLARIGDPGVASVWLDGARINAALAAAGPGREGAPRALESGRLVAGVRFTPDSLELAGRFVSGATAPANAEAGPRAGTGIDDLPADTVAALSVNGLGAALSDWWSEFEDGIEGQPQVANTLTRFEEEYGLDPSRDLGALLGEQTTLAYGGVPTAGATPRIALVTDGEADVARRVAAAFAGSGTTGVRVHAAGDRTVLALSQGYARDVAAGSGLTTNPAFAEAVPGADAAQFAGFVDLQALAERSPDLDAGDRADLEAFSALGITGTADGADSSWQVRLTLR
ncbi:hypothetical protein [Janibacter sp. G56]|uniref:hypothetical protein n=1 Tax=Janibacter sp. G56 TaxID=3418717 RepID=UPI003CFD9B34